MSRQLKKVGINDIRKKIREAIKERGYTVNAFCSDQQVLRDAGLGEYKNPGSYLSDSGPSSFVFLSTIYRYLGLSVMKKQIPRIDAVTARTVLVEYENQQIQMTVVVRATTPRDLEKKIKVAVMKKLKIRL